MKNNKENANKNLRMQQISKQIKKDIVKGELPKVYNIIKKTPEDWDAEPTGQEYSKCKCGTVFKQDYFGELNKYSDYITCLKCRHKERWKKEKEINEEKNKKKSNVFYPQYTPFLFQEEMHKGFENHRFILLSVGNRGGKDFFSIMAGIKYFVECLRENRHIYEPTLIPSVRWWLVAPTEDLCRTTVWQILRAYFPKSWIVSVSDSTMTMQTVFGGLIEGKTSYDPDKLVGVALDLITITEAARIKNLKTVWSNLLARLTSDGRGRACDRNGKKYGMGKAIVNSSPIGKGEFYEMFCWGQKNHYNYDPDWISYQFPWTANPNMKEYAETTKKTNYGYRTNAEIMRNQMGDTLYRQSYLAEFVSADGSVYPQFSENCVKDILAIENLNIKQQKSYILDWQSPKPYISYRVGWDIATGSSGDTPTVVIRNMDNGNIVKLVNLYGKNYDEQYDTIAYWCKIYNNAECVYSTTGHTAVVGQLSKRGVSEIAINEQGENKKKYVLALSFAVQNRAITVLKDGTEDVDTLILQMEDYSEHNSKYSNNQESHDDWVSALYLCYYDYEIQSFEIPYIGYMEVLDYNKI